MPESAVARIAAKLEAKKAAAAAAPIEEEEALDTEALDDAHALDEEEDELVGSEEAEANGASTKPLSMKERAAALRAAKGKAPKVTVANAIVSEAKGATTKASTPAASTPTKSSSSKSAAKSSRGKKQPSPAQLAAREAFAARSKAKAAEAAAARTAAKAEVEVEEPEPTPKAKKAIGSSERKPVQTEAEVKSSQNAKRRAEREAAAAKTEPKRVPTSKPKTVQQASTKAAKVAAAPKTAPAAVKASHETRGGGDKTKEKVLALWAKGRTRKQIMETLSLSYASVFYHTRGVEGAGAGTRGRFFVDSPYDEDGAKLRGSKTQEVSRSEAMRRMFLSSSEPTVSEVAKAHGVKYQIAYTAIKPLLGDAEE